MSYVSLVGCKPKSSLMMRGNFRGRIFISWPDSLFEMFSADSLSNGFAYLRVSFITWTTTSRPFINRDLVVPFNSAINEFDCLRWVQKVKNLQ